MRWSDIDLENKKPQIEQSVEETKKYGLRYKGPKHERHKRTISIDDELAGVLRTESDKHHLMAAGILEGAGVDLSLVRLPDRALVFPRPTESGTFSFTAPRRPRSVTKEFQRKFQRRDFGVRLHDLRRTHETILLDKGVSVKTVAKRCGHDPAVLLRNYAKCRGSADDQAAAVIGALAKGILGGNEAICPNCVQLPPCSLSTMR